MADAILTNPDAPLASAHRLVAGCRRSRSFPADLTEPVASMLGRWLAAHPDCRARANTPERSWCEAARHAHQHGQGCETFRRRKCVTTEVESTLKWIAIAAGYAGKIRRKPAHADPAVRSEAEKLMRALRARRMTWDQLIDSLQQIRSLGRKRGRQRAATTAVRQPFSLRVSDELLWREIVTVRELASIGRANGLCTYEPEYARNLKSGTDRFFMLEDGNSEVLALISVKPRAHAVESARAPGNDPIQPCYRNAVVALLDALEIGSGDSDDLLALGLSDAMPEVDLRRPDKSIGDIAMWFGSASSDEEDEEDEEYEDEDEEDDEENEEEDEEADDKEEEDEEDEEDGLMMQNPRVPVLIRSGDGFGLVRPLGHAMSDCYMLQVAHGAEFDSDDLLGRLLSTLRSDTLSGGRRP